MLYSLFETTGISESIFLVCFRPQSYLRANPTQSLWTTGALAQWFLNAVVAFVHFYIACNLCNGMWQPQTMTVRSVTVKACENLILLNIPILCNVVMSTYVVSGMLMLLVLSGCYVRNKTRPCFLSLPRHTSLLLGISTYESVLYNSNLPTLCIVINAWQCKFFNQFILYQYSSMLGVPKLVQTTPTRHNEFSATPSLNYPAFFF